MNNNVIGAGSGHNKIRDSFNLVKKIQLNQLHDYYNVETIFENGKLLKKVTFQSIRDNIDKLS